MNGQRSKIRSGKETLGGHELFREKPRARKVAPWPWNEASWTPWNWSEARDQFETKRLTKSKVK